MSNSSASSPMDELHERLHSLDSEVALLRTQLEEQSWRMAQLVLENAALKAQLGAGSAANETPRRVTRNRAAIVSREEVEFALSMGRGAALPPG